MTLDHYLTELCNAEYEKIHDREGLKYLLVVAGKQISFRLTSKEFKLVKIWFASAAMDIKQRIEDDVPGLGLAYQIDLEKRLSEEAAKKKL